MSRPSLATLCHNLMFFLFIPIYIPPLEIALEKKNKQVLVHLKRTTAFSVVYVSSAPIAYRKKVVVYIQGKDFIYIFREKAGS